MLADATQHTSSFASFLATFLIIVLVGAVIVAGVAGVVHLFGGTRTDVHHSGKVQLEVSGTVQHEVAGRVEHLHAGRVDHVVSLDPEDRRRLDELANGPRMVVDATPTWADVYAAQGRDPLTGLRPDQLLAAEWDRQRRAIEG